VTLIPEYYISVALALKSSDTPGIEHASFWWLERWILEYSSGSI